MERAEINEVEGWDYAYGSKPKCITNSKTYEFWHTHKSASFLCMECGESYALYGDDEIVHVCEKNDKPMTIK